MPQKHFRGGSMHRAQQQVNARLWGDPRRKSPLTDTQCSGENPCQRCIDNGKRCFYSEDQTAAEALQNLSRPTPAQPQPQPHMSAPTNGNGLSRRNILPRHGSIERRASDASVLGLSMESRMARIETMMEALIHERGMTMTPMGSIERDENGSDGLRSEAAFALPLLDPINPALAQMEQQSDMQYESPDWRHPLSQFEDRSNNAEPPVAIRLGSRSLSFPGPTEYRKYMDKFFYGIHLLHPCIRESEFRAFGERTLATGDVQSGDRFSLALSYIIFACCDVLLATSSRSLNGKPEGWHWFQRADDLVDKKTLLTCAGNLALIQLLLFQALYLSFADIPSSAYTTIGLTSRLVFQYGLHQERSLSHLSPEQLYDYVCVFWNVFVTDRSISLSCGRPYSIREKDINVGLPMDVFNKVLVHRSPSVDVDPRHYINLYMNYTTLLAYRAGHIWDTIIDASSLNNGLDSSSETAALLSSQINHFLTYELPAMRVPNIPGNQGAQATSFTKTTIALNSNTITLLLRRREMTSLQYDGTCARELGDIALDSMSHLSSLTGIFKHQFLSANMGTFRHHITSSVAGALLVFCALVVRDLSAPDVNLQHNSPAYVRGFRDACTLLDTLSHQIPYAKRVLDDFEALRTLVNAVIQEFTADGQVPGGWVLVEPLIPHNVVELFPYRALTPSFHAQNSLNPGDVLVSGQDVGSAWTSGGGGGVLWL
ncbi:Nn.00g061090.m01.CDS01 [Neocucurbitaria sp. VM-36]